MVPGLEAKRLKISSAPLLPMNARLGMASSGGRRSHSIVLLPKSDFG